jgi:tRNA pseudouridine32 synthase/23S rRNA pseudouridine746 synthase
VNEPTKPLEVHVKVRSPDDGAVEILHRATGLPKQRLKAAMTKGAVWLSRGSITQRLRRAKRALQANDELHLYYNTRVLAEVPPEPTLIADVGGYSVWRKPCGMRSQGSKWGDHCTVMRWAEQHLQPERTSFTVHRLDLAANGLILVAHSKTVAAALSKLFREREIEKRYRAIVSGDLSGQTEPLRVEEPIDDKAAASEVSFRQLSADGARSVVDVRIETGRKHQIRKHLASIGHPVRGDRMYGTGESDGVDLQLTACELAFHCPVTDAPVTYRLPDEWLPMLDAS